MKITDLKALKKFVLSETVCSVAVPLSNNEVHVAPVLFWCDVTSLKIYFSTSIETEKMWWHRVAKESINAAVAIGLTRGLEYQLQMRGRLQIFDWQSNPEVKKQFDKIASELDSLDSPNRVMCEFIPRWARFTDRANGYIQHQIDL